ncbi:MAG: type II secretion system F family protein [Paracoccaceae bacterium]
MIDFQSPSVAFAVYVSVFIGTLLAFEGLRELLTMGQDPAARRNRRMRMIGEGASTDEVLDLLMPDSGGSAAKDRSLSGVLRRMLRQAGLAISPLVFLGGAALLGGAVFVVGLKFVTIWAAAAGALVLALVLPLMVLDGMRKDRGKKLARQLPDALDLMARGLKVGHPLAVTVESVASEMPDPIGSEFGLIQDQVSYGVDIVTAFRDFADRTALEDTRYLAVSVGIQHGTGGNLARVLNVLSKVIRDRTNMRKKIKAISSEGRLSAVILSILPLGIFAMIHLTTPSFYGDVRGDPLFIPAMAVIFGLIVVQGIILHRLVNFRF